jgi:hypothetical protein
MVGMLRYGTEWCFMVRYVTVRYGTVRYVMVRYGTLRYGTVRYGIACSGVVRFVFHSTLSYTNSTFSLFQSNMYRCSHISAVTISIGRK